MDIYCAILLNGSNENLDVIVSSPANMPHFRAQSMSDHTSKTKVCAAVI